MPFGPHKQPRELRRSLTAWITTLPSLSAFSLCSNRSEVPQHFRSLSCGVTCGRSTTMLGWDICWLVLVVAGSKLVNRLAKRPGSKLQSSRMLQGLAIVSVLVVAAIPKPIYDAYLEWGLSPSKIMSLNTTNGWSRPNVSILHRAVTPRGTSWCCTARTRRGAIMS